MDGNVPDRPDLSREENQFLQRMANGMSSRQIAEELKINVRTVETLMREILRKLGLGPDGGRPPDPP
jgi:DNA-binding CsgD family transcriptional regulator